MRRTHSFSSQLLCAQPVQSGHRALNLPSGEAEIVGWIPVPPQEWGATPVGGWRSVLGPNCTPNPGVEGVNICIYQLVVNEKDSRV